MISYTTLFAGFGKGIVYCLSAFIFILVAKWIADKRTVHFDDDHEIVENSNLAVGYRRVGLYFSIAIALTGPLSGAEQSFFRDFLSFLVDGVLVLACLFISREINDRIVLSGIDNDDEAKKGNAAVGLSECGMYIATGLVLNGAFSGEDPGFIHGIASAVVFFFAGQIVLILCAICHRTLVTFSIKDEIRKGNAAAGVLSAGMFVAIGIVLRSSVLGPSLGWKTDFITFGLSAVYGIILFLVFEKLVDAFLLPKTTVKKEVVDDHNISAIALSRGVLIAAAVIVGAVM